MCYQLERHGGADRHVALRLHGQLLHLSHASQCQRARWRGGDGPLRGGQRVAVHSRQQRGVALGREPCQSAADGLHHRRDVRGLLPDETQLAIGHQRRAGRRCHILYCQRTALLDTLRASAVSPQRGAALARPAVMAGNCMGRRVGRYGRRLLPSLHPSRGASAAAGFAQAPAGRACFLSALSGQSAGDRHAGGLFPCRPDHWRRAPRPVAAGVRVSRLLLAGLPFPRPGAGLDHAGCLFPRQRRADYPQPDGAGHGGGNLAALYKLRGLLAGGARFSAAACGRGCGAADRAANPANAPALAMLRIVGDRAERFTP